MIVSEQTAYARSQQAALALMQSAQTAQSELERAERRKAEHKRAARVWFDLLEELDPPVGTEEYWVAVAAKVNRAYNENGEMPLLRHMLMGLMGYLEEAEKERQKHGISGFSENEENRK